jgi:flagellar biosynthesis chaperone FliJ
MSIESKENVEDVEVKEGSENQHDDNAPESDEDDEHESTGKVDSELDDAESDSDREEIIARRKEQRKSRNQRNREKVEALERNLQALAAQNATLQQQVSGIQDANVGSQLAQVDQAIAQHHQAAEHFKKIIAQAAQQGDGKTIAEATEYMIAARQKANDLTTFKANATRAINAPKPLNPQLVNKSQQFLGKNRWYGGPSSADADSKVLTALDNSLTAEGWDATSDAYWSELESRAKKYIPHRFENRNVKTPRDTVGGGGTGSQGAGDRAGSFILSADRVQAIKSAGMWDDSATRKKMIETYRKYDRENGRK